MSLLGFALVVALGGAPVPPTSPVTPTWAGLPVQSLASVGLQNPILALYGSGWQASLAGGGFVRATLLPTTEEARAEFAAQRQSAATRITGAFDASRLLHSEDVDAWGDGTNLLVFRDANLVFVVRDLGGDALGVSRKVQQALVRTVPDGILDTRSVDGVTYRWDACGWRHAP